MLKKANKENYTYDSYCDLIYRKKKISLVFKILLLILIWAPLVTYYFLPISKANIDSINGNALNFNEDYIYSYTSLDNKRHLWDVNTKKIENELMAHPYCSNAKVSLTFEGIKIDVKEIKLVAKNNDADLTYYLSNGSIKLDSAIKDLLKDPHAEEYKFIKPYIDSVPTIDVNEFNDNEVNEIFDNLGNLNHNLLKNIKTIKKNSDTTKFLMTTIVMDKEVYHLDNDININLDYRDIDRLLDEEVISKITNLIKENGNKYYNVLLDFDVDKKGVKKGIKITPYNESL